MQPKSRLTEPFVLLLIGFLLTVSLPEQGYSQGEIAWQQTNGPTGGSVQALLLTPAGHLFAGTPGSGIFRSTDEGDTWTQINMGLTNLDVRAFARNLSGHLFAGTAGGVFRSSDHGDAWEQISTGLASTNIRAFVVNDLGYLFAGTAGGVFGLPNNGTTWTQLAVGLTNRDVRALALNTWRRVFLFAGTPGGIFRSADNGSTWSRINTGLTNTRVQALVVNKASGLAGTPSHLFAGTQGGGVFRSTDNGDTWTPINTGLTNRDVRVLIVNALGHIFAGTAGGVFRSTDNGNTWTPINAGLMNRDVHALARNVSGFLFAGTVAGGVFRSVQSTTPDFWNWRFAGAPSTRVHSIRLDPEDENVWYVGSSEEGLYITRDGGRTWEQSLAGIGLNSEGFVIDPQNPNRVYAALLFNLLVSEDKGLGWNVVHTFSEGIRSIHVSPRDGSIYVGPQTNPPGIYKSADGGRSWARYAFPVSLPSNRSLIPWDIEEDPKSGALYVGAEITPLPSPYDPPFFRSFDGGVTWEEVSGLLPWHVIKIQVNHTNQEVFALTEGPGLYKSSDFGSSWQFLSRFFALELLLDQQHPNRLFGGEHTFGRLQGGVFVSTDGGSGFQLIGLPDIRVASLTLNRAGTRLYAAGYGAGIFMASVPE